MKLPQSLSYYFAVVALVVLLPFQSCKEQTDLDVNEDVFVEIEIPDAYKVPPGARFGVDDIIEETVPIIVTRIDGRDVQGMIRVRAINDQSLLNFGVSQSLMRDLGLENNFWVNNLESGNDLQAQAIGTCLKACKDAFEKGEGRGWCKAGCWGELVLKLAAIVAAVAAL